jgi:catechol 2,3-dioxygenase-like lactoylglutathione lyase family enzyme
MGLLKIEGVTHWSILVNNQKEAEKFYGDLLGLKLLGRLGNSGMTCFNVGDTTSCYASVTSLWRNRPRETSEPIILSSSARRPSCRPVRFFTKEGPYHRARLP